MEISKLIADLGKKTKEAELELCNLIKTVDSEALLTIMCTQLLSGSPESSIGDKFGNHPAMLEILAYFCIPKFGENKGKKVSIKETIECYSLLEKCFMGKLFPNDTFIEDSNFDSISTNLKMKSNIVRGSAYASQIEKLIRGILCHFDNWFIKKINISPSRVLEIINCLVDTIENTLNSNLKKSKETGEKLQQSYLSLKNKKNKTEREKKIISMFTSLDTIKQWGFYRKFNKIVPSSMPIDLLNLPLENKVTDEEYQALKSLIGISKENYHTDILLQRYPLIFLNSGKVLITQFTNCLEVIKDRFEKIAKGDNKFYSTRYQKYKAIWSEQETKKLVSKIFPESSIYETLDYPDPDKEKGNAELDIAVDWGPFLIIIEVKAKQFRFESVRGDVGRLRTDIKTNIEEAFNQSLRAIKYIDSVKNPILIERKSKRELTINKEKIKKIYPLSVTLENLGEIATELHKTKELGLFKDKDYPYSVSILDLELITEMELKPEIFLHYIERRLYHLNFSENIKGDELDLIESYLDCRLNNNNIQMDDNNESFNFLSFSGYSNRFDELDMYNRGLIQDKPKFNLSMPPIVEDILVQLSSKNTDKAKWIIFSMLDLDDSLLYELSNCLKEITNVTIPMGRFRRYSFSNDKIVISVVATTFGSLSQLEKNLIFRTKIEKYKRKVDKSIGFGIVVSNNISTNIIDHIEFLEKDWIHDDKLEKEINNEPAFIPASNSKVPGRNDKCFCGSGKKYKKCCLEKVNRNRRILR